MRLVPCVFLLLASTVASVSAGITFGPSIPISNSLSRISQSASSDLDGDGDLDLLASGAEGTQLAWWSNDGKGNFRRAGEWFCPIENAHVAKMADFTGDGKIDLLVGRSSQTVSGVVHYSIFSSLGMQGFGPQGAELPFTDALIVVADLDSDGTPEILTQTATWFLKTPGPYESHPSNPLPLSFLQFTDSLSWADTDGNAGPDSVLIATGREIQRCSYQNETGFGAIETLVRTDPNGDFILSVESLNLPSLSTEPCLLTFEKPSQLYSDRRSLSLYVRRSGTYQKAATVALNSVIRKQEIERLIAVTEGNLTRLLIRSIRPSGLTRKGNYTGDSLTEVFIRVTRGIPILSFKLLASPPAPCTQPHFADLNQDGLSDLITPLSNVGTYRASVSDQLIWFPGKRGGLVDAKPRAINQTAFDATLRFAGDLDGDGDVDLLTQHGELATNQDRSVIALWKNSGHAESFERKEIFTRGSTSSVVSVVDRNNDGRPDILIFCTTHAEDRNTPPVNELVEFTALANGTYRQKVIVSETGPAWLMVELRDGNQDGLLDLRIFTYDNSHWIRALDQKRFDKPSNPLPAEFPKHGEDLCDPDWDGDLDVWGLHTWTATSTTPPWPVLPTHSGMSIYVDNEYHGLGEVDPVDEDFNGDGHPDFISIQQNTHVPLLADGTLNPDNSLYPLNSDLTAIAATPRFLSEVTNYLDVDRDGDLDAVYARSTIGLIPATLVWRENFGGLLFSVERDLASAITSGRETVACTDLDGDGILDLVCSSKANATRLEWFKGVRSSP